jgi:hypothetical protein
MSGNFLSSCATVSLVWKTFVYGAGWSLSSVRVLVNAGKSIAV